MGKENIIINDKHEIHNIYGSQCSSCKHFDSLEYKCIAFPNGIPDELLTGEMKHDEVIKGQTGNTTFEVNESFS